MKQLFVKFIRSTRGSSIVELAMVAPVMLILIVGSLDMGSMFVRKMEIANAAKAGVQYALVRKPVQGDVSHITAAVKDSLGPSMTPSTSVNVELYCLCHGVKQICTDPCTDAKTSAFVNVTVSENFTTPFFNYSWFTSNFPISESATIELN